MKKVELDNILREHIKKMIDTELEIDIDQKWNEFERRLKQKRRDKYIRLVTVTAAAVIIFLLVLPVFFPSQLTAFKNELYQWFSRDYLGDTVIIEKSNPKIKPGKYENLSFDQAKEYALFELKYPKYVPGLFSNKAVIEAVVSVVPKSVISITFRQGEKDLVIRQERLVPEESTNTHVPADSSAEKVMVNNNEVVIIKKEPILRFSWVTLTVRYTVTARNIEYDEVLKTVISLMD